MVPKPVGHDLEEVAVRHAAQRSLWIRRRLLVAALHDHALAGADPVVARRAVDVVALAAAQQQVARDRQRVGGHRRLRADAPVKKASVLVEMPARHRRPAPAAATRAGRRRTALRSNGWYLGWSCMSWRHPAARARRRDSNWPGRRTSAAGAWSGERPSGGDGVAALPGRVHAIHLRHLARLHARQEAPGRRRCRTSGRSPRCRGRSGRARRARSAGR